ncbi:hypothetical protein D9615_009233 [Tricholomella constricta]|uniref:Uncharacterized protein n=1 Tax=Tricholomella constricta TaxID=117010 RepID=A0A8H5GWH3_9AGAR|nr:hypothetical protein D9615_009233 [Tricholomella constricta]
MSSSRKVVIDDTDSRIRYSGQGWFQDQGSQDNGGNFGPTYKRTSHGTNGNDSLSLTFQGTSIRVVGTTKLSRINETHWDPSWECFVDQISIGATKPFAFPENNWNLCQQSVLNDGQHEITVKVTSAGTTFWLDYLVFTPSPEVSYDEAVLLVENSDTGILYDSSWGALGGTANMTTKKGSQVKFDFTGKSVTWVGFIPTELSHNPGFGSYSIDGGAPITFKLNGLSPKATVTVYNQVFFTTPDLTPGPHSLVVTYNGADEGAATPLTLDYLYVTNASLPSSSSPPSVGFTSSLSPTPSPSSGTISQETQEQDSGPPVGGIVGGVLGGLALIALLLFLLWWRRRQQHRANPVGSSAPGLLSFGTNHTPQEVTPFMSMHPSAQPKTYTYANPPLQPQRPLASTASAGISQSEFNSAPPHSQSLNTNDNSHATQSAPRTHTQNRSNDSSDFSGYAPVTVAQTRAMRKGQEAGALQPSVTSVLHQDSGIRLPQHRMQNTVVEDIPPLYTVT